MIFMGNPGLKWMKKGLLTLERGDTIDFDIPSL
jgi:hypothetical protein